MKAITDIFGPKICFVDEKLGLLEVKNRTFHYYVTLIAGQTFQIENERSLTVITRTDTAFITKSCRLIPAA